jgi:hypothetical protein
MISQANQDRNLPISVDSHQKIIDPTDLNGNKHDQISRQKNAFKRAKSDINEVNYFKSLSSNISKAPSFLRIYFQNSTAVVKMKIAF